MNEITQYVDEKASADCEYCPLKWKDSDHEGVSKSDGCYVDMDTNWCKKTHSERKLKAHEFEHLNKPRTSGINEFRDCEYRGKDKESGKWVHGYLLKCDGKYFILEKDKQKSWQLDLTEVYPETIGEYTGILDIDKNKVFEGDLVECEDVDGIIVYFKDSARFALNYEDVLGNRWNIGINIHEKIKVVGTIHD